MLELESNRNFPPTKPIAGANGSALNGLLDQPKPYLLPPFTPRNFRKLPSYPISPTILHCCPSVAAAATEAGSPFPFLVLCVVRMATYRHLIVIVSILLDFCCIGLGCGAK